MKVLFFGSSSYCLPIAQKLFHLGHLSAIITKPTGLIAEFAQKNSVTNFFVTSREELFRLKRNLEKINLDIAVVSDFGLIIPKEIFSLPKHQTLNIHFSILPEFRGASPVQYTIRQGRKTAGISVVIMDERLDTGDIIWQKEILLTGQETSEELYKKLFNIISIDLPDIINKFTSGKLKPKKQDHSKATYTKILTRQDGYISWEKLLDKKYSQEIYRKFRAFYPWPGIWTKIDMKGEKKRLKILKFNPQPTTYNLQPEIVQLEGKNPVTWKQFQDGYKLTT
ncbi:hypothetical protein HYW54_05125 [Candidatus Gottesmanbacteria bacterium]|nr:hypothetical protein [Candidatus Gottesmanbacteria bacterium]